MPYIDRDQAGNIVSFYANPQREGHEWVETAELWVAPPSPQEQIDQIERDIEGLEKEIMAMLREVTA